MTKTGQTRRMDDLGRVVIPRDIRFALGLRDGDLLDISVDAKGVYFTKAKPTLPFKERLTRLAGEVGEAGEIPQERKAEIVATLLNLADKLSTPT